MVATSQHQMVMTALHALRRRQIQENLSQFLNITKHAVSREFVARFFTFGKKSSILDAIIIHFHLSNLKGAYSQR